MTVFPSLGAEAGSLALQSNIGPIPFDRYATGNNSSDGAVVANCPSTSTVRQCVQAELASYRAQGVSAVRFMFALGGGGHSTPLSRRGALGSSWVSNVRLFMQDVAAAGLTGVIPPPIYGGWGGDAYQVDTVTDFCTHTSVRYTFYLTTPYAVLSPANAVPPSAGLNAAYTCSPKNPHFVGWAAIYTVFDAVVSAAQAASLAIPEFDINNEINVAWFTVEARMIYDVTDTNSNADVYGLKEADVLGNVRAILGKYGYAQGVATYSTVATPVSKAGFDCNNAWGDSARLSSLSALFGAFQGTASAFGSSPNLWKFKIGNNNLACDAGNFTRDSMPSLPRSYVLPAVIDVHDYSTVLSVMNGQPTSTSSLIATDTDEITDQIELDNALAGFLAAHGGMSATAMIGETFSNDPVYGEQVAHLIPDKITGLLESNLMSCAVAVRPWGDMISSAFQFPQNLAPYTTALMAPRSIGLTPPP